MLAIKLARTPKRHRDTKRASENGQKRRPLDRLTSSLNYTSSQFRSLIALVYNTRIKSCLLLEIVMLLTYR